MFFSTHLMYSFDENKKAKRKKNLLKLCVTQSGLYIFDYKTFFFFTSAFLSTKFCFSFLEMGWVFWFSLLKYLTLSAF